MQHELDESLRSRVVREALGDGGIERRRVDVHARSRLHHEHRDQPGYQCENREHVEERHRLHQRLADLLAVVEAGDSEHDRAEDDGRDHHLHELHEAIAERLQRGAELRPVVAHCDAECEPDQYLEVQRSIELGELHNSSFRFAEHGSRLRTFQNRQARRVGEIVERMDYTVNCK